MHLDVWFTTMTHRLVQQAHTGQGANKSSVQKYRRPSYLNVARQLLKYLVDLVLESSTQHFISLVEHKHFDVFGRCKIFQTDFFSRVKTINDLQLVNDIQ